MDRRVVLVKPAGTRLAGILVLLFLLVGVLPAQITLTMQDFNGNWSTTNPPPGWRIHYTGTPQSSDWHRAPDLARDPWTENTTNYALLCSIPGKVVADSLVSPVINCNGYGSIVLRCSTMLGAGTRDYRAAIIGSSDGGQTWPHEVRTYPVGTNLPPALESIPLTWATGVSGLRLAWVFVGNTGNFLYWAIDDFSVTGLTMNLDVGTSRIVVPVDYADSGTTITPSAWVINRGTEPASFDVKFRIGTTYASSSPVSDLAPGESTFVEFSLWMAYQRGVFPVRCSTELMNDMHPENDAKSETVEVVIADVAVINLTAPRDTLDSVNVVAPEATVQNQGSGPATFNVIMRIGESYCDTQHVENLLPSNTQIVLFRAWIVGPRDLLVVKCSTSMSGDVNPDNNCLMGAVYVRVVDVGVMRVLEPRGAVPESTTLSPKILFANFGNTNPRFGLQMRIVLGGDTVYVDSIQPAMVAPGTRDSFIFRPVYITQIGRYKFLGFTRLPADMNPYNDFDTTTLIVGLHDVRVMSIWEPNPRTVPGEMVPAARIRNQGLSSENFWTHFRIRGSQGVVYRDSQLTMALPAGEERTLYFARWSATVGRFGVFCSTALGRDLFPENDKRADSSIVENSGLGWTLMDSIPPGPAAKYVNSGGALTLRGDSLIYAFKGNKRQEFYVYNIRRDGWAERCSIPFSLTGTKKKVTKGGTLAWSSVDDRIYAFKGGGTLEFWSYNSVLNDWQELTPLPGEKKKIKGGGSLVAVPTRKLIYGFKGGSTREFYAYDITAGTWAAKREIGALIPDKPKPVKDGGCLTLASMNGDSVLLALKGGGTREYWGYWIARDSWAYLDSVPYGPLKRSKVKDGGTIAWNRADHVFMFKGGKTNEVLCHAPDMPGAAWPRAETIPGPARVKGGGALCYAGGFVYGLKGGGSAEFWRYMELPTIGIAEAPRPVVNPRPGWLAVEPTLSRGRFIIRLAPAISGNARVEICDLTGRRVKSLRSAECGMRNEAGRILYWDGTDRFGRRLPAGVYIIRLTGTAPDAVKVILQQ